MAISATATATMAAAGMDKRASTVSSSSSLQTPSSASYPSELRSPMVGSPGFIKREDGLKTPITPPSAYLDFLKQNMNSPALLSPAPTSTSARFSFNEKPSLEPTSERASNSPPSSQPVISRNSSYDSNASSTSSASAKSLPSQVSASSKRERPQSPRIAIPPSPFVKPGPRSARTPKRLHIPQSPVVFSPGAQSATVAHSPYASTPLSAAPWSASFSPRSYHPDDPTTGPPGKVTVRQVVTRTITYCRTPLEPAPKGKRRKIEEVLKEESEEPPMKQEKTESTSSISPRPSPKPSPEVVPIVVNPILEIQSS
ncbi:hypothetical protein K431DRAFT_285963 [Polychaeton citri CBS 116435]|uniref:Uncharacterized protein n=1 Tax=Polychaeton citri CBS 116435 TaxID=1314669 RepID=A0A9P4Q489_9PEZI|nr:hypothetical protein K431DRAFT_285963 [Polychaeton citri CBS 116435]